MPDIVLNKQFVTTLARRLKQRFGPEVKHTAVIEEVAAALGLRPDALMHKLKHDEAATANGKAKDEAIARTAASLLKQGPGHFDMAELNRKEEPLDDRGTVFPGYLVCLEDGKKVIMLKRYVRTLGLAWEEYLTKHDLPGNYPGIAPAYASAKRQAGSGSRPEADPDGMSPA